MTHELRVAQALRDCFDVEDEQVWLRILHRIEIGFATLESLVAHHGAGVACGDAPGPVNCNLASQLYAAARCGVDPNSVARIAAAGTAAAALAAFARTQPAIQPDADPA